jgi:hypothetical protein
MHDEESKIYVSGSISFLKDDPGRQVSRSVRQTVQASQITAS